MLRIFFLLGILGYDIFLDKNGDVQHNLTVMDFYEDTSMIHPLTPRALSLLDQRNMSKWFYSFYSARESQNVQANQLFRALSWIVERKVEQFYLNIIII